MAKSQGEAVFQAVNEVLNGEISGEVKLSKEQLHEVHSKVFLAFASGDCVHSKNPSEAELLKYIPGLVNNWLRKDKRLNGGIVYMAKNPGSRKGSGDESLKAMKQLLEVTTDSDARTEIQTAIDARLAELNPPKKINADVLPEALRKFVK
jgi:hypothetical protein